MTQLSRIDGLPDLPKLPEAHQRLRDSIAWLRDGEPHKLGIGVADMVTIEAALSRYEAGSAAAAQAAKQVPAGFVLVPREPTMDMYNAAVLAYQNWSAAEVLDSTFTHIDVWNAMIAAAPSATSLAEAAEAGTLAGFVLDVDESIPDGEVHVMQNNKRIATITNIAATPASPQAPAPQAVVGEASEQRLVEALLAVQMSAVAVPDVSGEHAISTSTLAKVERALGAYSLTAPAKDRKRLPVTVCCGRTECGGECSNEWAGMEDVSPAPSAAPHQGADALREAAESLFEAVRAFRNEPKLERLIGLRSTEGYGRLVEAWDDYADARAALAQHQAPQQGEQQ